MDITVTLKTVREYEFGNKYEADFCIKDDKIIINDEARLTFKKDEFRKLLKFLDQEGKV